MCYRYVGLKEGSSPETGAVKPGKQVVTYLYEPILDTHKPGDYPTVYKPSVHFEVPNDYPTVDKPKAQPLRNQYHKLNNLLAEDRFCHNRARLLGMGLIGIGSVLSKCSKKMRKED